MRKLLLYSVLILLVILSVGPFLWLLSTALKNTNNQWTLHNFVEVWQKVPMAAYYTNSMIVTGLSVVFNLVFSVLAAYPLARFEFKGKNAIFMIILATMMIPFQVIMIPLYLIVLKLNLVDTHNAVAAYLGVIIPFVVGGFGIFLVRQEMVHIPKQLEESAIMDGCNSFQVLIQVVLPLIKPTLATLAVFTFMANWGEFLWPSITLTKPELYTLPLGLVYLQGAFSANWKLIAAGTILATIPVVVFFLLLQRYFVSGTLSGAVKG